MKDVLIRLMMNWLAFLGSVWMTYMSLSGAKFMQAGLWIFISSICLVKIYKLYQ